MDYVRDASEFQNFFTQNPVKKRGRRQEPTVEDSESDVDDWIWYLVFKGIRLSDLENEWSINGFMAACEYLLKVARAEEMANRKAGRR